MSPLHPDEDPFVREIRRQADRAHLAQRLTFWQGIGLVGSVGWMVVIPTLIGAFLGRCIDAREGTNVFWTPSVLFAGLAISCLGAWRHLEQELRR
ncbi:MAG: AtpZ/AtpI family protein [Isosphaeraceae bacterium]